MSVVTFFKNVRNDGGVRTGVALEGEVVLEDFREGREPDPALVWYVDLTFESAKIPTEHEALREWLVAQGEWIKAGLDQVAAKMELGIDQDWIPFSYALPQAPRGIKARLTGSAIRRVRIDDFAKHLQQVRDEWEKGLRRLKSPAPSTW